MAVYVASNDSAQLWWKTGIIYQVYPRSFLDGCSPNCTGTGSLIGIQQKLPYLRDLGVAAIWISPIYDSPMADFGYDISNYTSIWPTFGTMKDFDNLIEEAHKLGIRVILDYVPNHTSNEHPWFLESKSNKKSEKRDWYVWRDSNGTKEDGKPRPPNNWRTMFCKDEECSGWKYDKSSDQWYYHCFLEEQPDLNWRNPEVVTAMHDVLRFWLRKGVDGFRVDAFANILEDENFRSEPLNKDWHGDPVADGYGKLLHIYTENQPGLHQIVRDMQKVLQEFGTDKVLIGEIYADNVVTERDVVSFYGTETEPEFNMPFNMNLISFFDYTSAFDPTVNNNPRNATILRTVVNSYNNLLPHWAQPNYVLGNHDVRRLVSRLKNDTSLARVATTILLTLRGTPTIYNGDEFGQKDGYVPKGRRQDPNCIVDYGGLRCRDPERTPLQWNTSNTNAGFSGEGIKTWLPVSEEYRDINAMNELADSTSIISLVSHLLALRSRESALNSGSYESIQPPTFPESNSDYVFAFKRSNESDVSFVVVANLGTENITVDLVPFFEVVTSLELVADSEQVIHPNATVLIRKVNLNANHAVILRITHHADSTRNIVLGIVTGSLACIVLIIALIGIYYRFWIKPTRDGYSELPVEKEEILVGKNTE
eukprot:gene50-3446_t